MKNRAYFLAKADPSDYGLDQLERDQRTVWDGVRNPQALTALRAMRDGDCVLIYHSGGISAIVGWAFVAGDARTADTDPKSMAVEFEFGGRLGAPLTLAEIKEQPQFGDFALVRQGRLSTMAVPAEFIRWLKKVRKDFRA
jgi:predicted RNA-binding protein with PUA-like domain